MTKGVGLFHSSKIRRGVFWAAYAATHRGWGESDGDHSFARGEWVPTVKSFHAGFHTLTTGSEPIRDCVQCFLKGCLSSSVFWDSLLGGSLFLVSLSFFTCRIRIVIRIVLRQHWGTIPLLILLKSFVHAFAAGCTKKDGIKETKAADSPPWAARALLTHLHPAPHLVFHQ